MKKTVCLTAFALLGAVAISPKALAADTPAAAAERSAALDYDMKTLAGKDANLADQYAGKVVLLVNVASKCGFTPQYAALEALHEKYADQGLAVVGVPCNQFRNQEPGTADEIAEFCRQNYGVKFDMLAKVEVNGPGACPLYTSLTAMATAPQPAGAITWNFEKFLFSRDGKVVARFAPSVAPDSPVIISAIEKQLAKPK
jgi:glutathione peroxidase